VRGAPHHVDLTVADPSLSVPFYGAVLTRLGFRPLPVEGSAVSCWGLSGDGAPEFSIALQPARGAAAARPHDRRAPGLHHLAFHAAGRSEVDAFHAFLVERGFRVLDPPAEYPYTPGYYAVFFADPDGLKLEVVHEPAPAVPGGGATAR